MPYCETLEQYVYGMKTRRKILAVLALCTEKQREHFLRHIFDFSVRIRRLAALSIVRGGFSLFCFPARLFP